jgi:hypothetical protein
LIAGELLGAAVIDHVKGGSIKLESLKNQLIKLLVKRATLTDYFKVSRSTPENTIWPSFKSVSHLWAAYVVARGQNLSLPPRSAARILRHGQVVWRSRYNDSIAEAWQ